ncbi:MAG: aspartate aminotransferase family protein, partial [Chitinophagaceae bacterium]
GLWMAVEFDSFETNKKLIDKCIEAGVLTDWFLFASDCLRISPPLIISEGQIKKSCEVIIKACE